MQNQLTFDRMEGKFVIKAVSFLKKLEFEEIGEPEPEAAVLLQKIAEADDALQAEGWDSRVEQQLLLEEAVLAF